MELATSLRKICSVEKTCRPDVLESVLSLAREIVQNGGEGRSTGALFTIGRADAVLSCSRPLILDPLHGYGPDVRNIANPDIRGTIKALAQLDGAFVVDDDGIVVAACRYLDALIGGVRVPLGLGTRHVAAAALSKQLGIIIIAVSQAGMIRVFFNGEIVDSVNVV
jgi:diadenylate cyclase